MSNKKRLCITATGCVQGVGFRPFVYRIASNRGLKGTICNTLNGVRIDVEGEPEHLALFQKELAELKPERASIEALRVEEKECNGFQKLEIAASSDGEKTELALLPDTAICERCLSEFCDPQNRRFGYPFIHCMGCGPRFSLFTAMPFDRKHTSMDAFSMCADCLKEYENPEDRRFFSQTNCCPKCGPKLSLIGPDRTVLAEGSSAIEQAIKLLKKKKIVALKNTGGYALLVDATDELAVQRLRARKQRPKKPFAVLCKSLEEAEILAELCPASRSALSSIAAPIVLLRGKGSLAPSVAMQSPYCGIMLAHNSLHHLLLQGVESPLVATSGNLSGMPICIDEEAAFEELGNCADAFLVHNRKIQHRLDDSVMQIIAGRPMVIRRARGLIPFAIPCEEAQESRFGAGGQMKNTFAIAQNGRIYLSQHIGDLDTVGACEAYEAEVKGWEALLRVKPTLAMCDLHPGYFTTEYVREQNFVSVPIRHHEAHVYSGMIDNQLAPPLFAICWDGTGFGDETCIWGAESFLVGETGCVRFASLSPFRLPGSEKAVKEPRRALLGALFAAYEGKIPCAKGFREDEKDALSAALEKGINSPLCSSMGRLFDAVSALLELCLINTFEGEGAMALEAAAHLAVKKTLRYRLRLQKEEIWRIGWEEMLRKMVHDAEEGLAASEIAWAFHGALAELAVEMARLAKMPRVLLTGGCMQNRLLSELIIERLRKAGFEPYWHCQIPPNDGGLAMGQVGAKQMEACNVSSSTR